MTDYDKFSPQESKDSSSSHTSHKVPASAVALCNTTEVDASSEPGPCVQETRAAVGKSFTHVRPSGSKVADRQKWLNGAFTQPELNKDSLLASKTNEMPMTSSNVMVMMETIGNQDILSTDMSKGMDNASANLTGTIETLGSKNSILSDSKTTMTDTAKVTPKTSSNETAMVETLGNKDSFLTNSKAKVAPKSSTNVTEMIEKFGNKDSFLGRKASLKMAGIVDAFGDKDMLLMDSKTNVTDTAQVAPNTSANVTETLEKFGSEDSLLSGNDKVTRKTSSNVMGMIEIFGNKDSVLTDSKAKVTDTAKLEDKTSSNVTAKIEMFGNEESLLTDKTKVTKTTSSNVAGMSETFGNKDSLLMDKAVTAKTSSNVTETIEKFGGKMTRQSRVQMRKQELECKLSLKNEGKPSVKTRWEGRPGAYKKKVVLSTYGY